MTEARHVQLGYGELAFYSGLLNVGATHEPKPAATAIS